MLRAPYNLEPSGGLFVFSFFAHSSEKLRIIDEHHIGLKHALYVVR